MLPWYKTGSGARKIARPPALVLLLGGGRQPAMIPGRAEKKAAHELSRKMKPANTILISTTSSAERSIFLTEQKGRRYGQASLASRLSCEGEGPMDWRALSSRCSSRWECVRSRVSDSAAS